jgi:hypothetical protein
MSTIRRFPTRCTHGTFQSYYLNLAEMDGYLLN